MTSYEGLFSEWQSIDVGQSGAPELFLEIVGQTAMILAFDGIRLQARFYFSANLLDDWAGTLCNDEMKDCFVLLAGCLIETSDGDTHNKGISILAQLTMPNYPHFQSNKELSEFGDLPVVKVLMLVHIFLGEVGKSVPQDQINKLVTGPRTRENSEGNMVIGVGVGGVVVHGFLEYLNKESQHKSRFLAVSYLSRLVPNMKFIIFSLSISATIIWLPPSRASLTMFIRCTIFS